MINNKVTAREIASQEAIAAYQGIIEIVKTPGLTIPKDIFDAALNWAKDRLSPPEPESMESKFFKPESPKPQSLVNLEFANRGAFYYACQTHFKKSKKEIDPIIEGLDLDSSLQRKSAWIQVIKEFGKLPEKKG